MQKDPAHIERDYPGEVDGWKASVIAMNGMAFDLSSPHGRMLATFLSGIASLSVISSVNG